MNYRGLKKKRKRQDMSKFLKRFTVENFPNMEKSIKSRRHTKSSIQERPKEKVAKHILIKLTKTKHKERILKAASEKQQVT